MKCVLTFSAAESTVNGSQLLNMMSVVLKRFLKNFVSFVLTQAMEIIFFIKTIYVFMLCYFSLFSHAIGPVELVKNATPSVIAISVNCCV